VDPNGHADLRLPSLAYKYGGIDTPGSLSPSRRKRDPSVRAIGVITKMKSATFADRRRSERFEVRDLDGDCKSTPVPRPTCKVTQVWKKALAQHPDVGDAVANIGYRWHGKRAMWDFVIREDQRTMLVQRAVRRRLWRELACRMDGMMPVTGWR